MAVTLDERALYAAVKTTVEAVTWEDGATRAFATDGLSVVVSSVPPPALASMRRTPIAQIIPQSQEYDEEEPGIRYVTFGVRLYVIDRRDDAGEAAVMGAVDDRGLLQLARRVDLAIQLIERNAVPITSRGTTSGAVTLDGGENIAYREHSYRAVTAVQPE